MKTLLRISKIAQTKWYASASTCEIDPFPTSILSCRILKNAPSNDLFHSQNVELQKLKISVTWFNSLPNSTKGSENEARPNLRFANNFAKCWEISKGRPCTFGEIGSISPIHTLCNQLEESVARMERMWLRCTGNADFRRLPLCSGQL